MKPAILECFGDICQAIGTQFDTYLAVVGQVLQQASVVTVSADVTMEMIDYIISLREGIMDAWGGIILSYKGTPQGTSPVFQSLFASANLSQLLNSSLSSSPSSSSCT